MALPRAASTTARPYKPEQCHRLGHAFELMAAAFLDDKETGDLALYLRRHDDRARLSERLDPCRSVWRIAINFPRRIDHYWSGVDTDARVERRLARICILAVHCGEGALD